MSISESQKSKVRSQKLETTAIVVNGTEREVTAGTTVLGLLDGLAIKPQGIAVELNLEIVPKSKFAETVLKEKDKIEIVRMVGGG